MIVIGRRASDSKVPHRLPKLMNNRVQASVATCTVLKLLYRIIQSATALLSQHIMGYRVLYKCPRLKVHHMNQAWQIQEMMPSMVRSVVAPTAPCLEHLRQMATALGAFWKAQYLCHTHIQFQVMFLEYQ